MSIKSLRKVGIAFGLLAAVLIILGVSFVPRIFASSSSQGKVVVTINQSYILHSHYSNEQYPRAIAPQASGYQRHLMLNYVPSVVLSGYQRHLMSNYFPSNAVSGYQRHLMSAYKP
jgi:hypothetical protein